MSLANTVAALHKGSNIADYSRLLKTELDAIFINKKKDYSQLVEILDDLELNILITSQDYTWEIAILHILAYFINWDLDNLRYLIKRIKPELKNRQEIALIIETFRPIWKKNFSNGFVGLNKAINFFENNQNIFGILKLLEEVILENFKLHVLKNFSVISFNDLKRMSGMTEKELEEFCAKNHWKKSPTGDIDLKDQYDNSKIGEILEKQVGQLTEMVSFMEKLN